MHKSSFDMMKILLGRHRALIEEGLEGKRARIADVGAMDINGTYKSLVVPWATYVGIDTAPGSNVDMVAALYEVPGGPYDAILCGQTLEHVEDMPRLVHAITRALRPGGICLLVAPHTCGEHKYPLDCWRIFPDGMNWLLRTAGLESISVFINEIDTWGVGRRLAETK